MEPEDLTFQLLQEITNDFSEERRIGAGSYGDVYKVRLEHAWSFYILWCIASEQYTYTT